MKTLLFVSSLLLLLLTATNAWNNTPNPFTKLFFSSTTTPRTQRSLIQFDEDHTTTSDKKKKKNNDNSEDQRTSSVHETRRRFLNAAAMNVCFLGAATASITTNPDIASAADTDTTTARTRYISGKAPQVPGGKPVDKSNVKGTRKDPDFLRSIGMFYVTVVVLFLFCFEVCYCIIQLDACSKLTDNYTSFLFFFPLSIIIQPIVGINVKIQHLDLMGLLNRKKIAYQNVKIYVVKPTNNVPSTSFQEYNKVL